MAIGTTKVKFIGGCLDGEVCDSFVCKGLTQKYITFNGYWFGAVDGSYQLLKGNRVGDNWRSYSVDVYEKEPKGNDGYFVYRFKEQDMINRCTALTLKGQLCSKIAIKNTDSCQTHTKKIND